MSSQLIYFFLRLLRSRGATEDLFVTRDLHQEPPSWTPTGWPPFRHLLRQAVDTGSLFFLRGKASPRNRHWVPFFNVFGMTGPTWSVLGPPSISFYDQQGLLRTYSSPGSSIRGHSDWKVETQTHSMQKGKNWLNTYRKMICMTLVEISST